MQQASEVGADGPGRVYVPRRHLDTQPLASLLVSAPARVQRNSESERRSPSSEDDRDERESRAEIQNAEDYNEIFQPKNSISETTPLPPHSLAPCCAVPPKPYPLSTFLHQAEF